MTARQANLLGALALAVGDRVQGSVAAETGRGGQSAAALAVLAQYDAVGIEGLRVPLGLSQPATVRLVDALVSAGLAARRPGADARSLTVVLTAKGRARAGAVLAARRGAVEAALHPLTGAERAALEPVLEKMLAAVTADRAQAELICRLCDLTACPAVRCPVESAAVAAGG
jgi:DNA-binding MarR family transcriptional regulator